jgi:hypothetical protein
MRELADQAATNPEENLTQNGHATSIIWVRDPVHDGRFVFVGQSPFFGGEVEQGLQLLKESRGNPRAIFQHLRDLSTGQGRLEDPTACAEDPVGRAQGSPILSQVGEDGNAEKEDEGEGPQRAEDRGRLDVQHNQAPNKDTLEKSSRGATGEMRSTTNNTGRHEELRIERSKKPRINCPRNSQPVETDERATHAFNINNKRAPWLNFAYKQPEAKGLGDDIVTEMVQRGGVIGNSEALEELKNVLVEIRQNGRESAPKSSQQMPLFGNATQSTALHQIIVSGGAHAANDACAPRSHSYDEDLYKHWRGIELAGAGEGFYAIMRRYQSARVQEEYKRRIALVKDPGRVPPVTQQQKTQVLRAMYTIVNPNAPCNNVTADDPKWNAFRRVVKRGLRWLMLEKEFTCGIYAILPRSRLPNTFVERKLDNTTFMLWCRMVSRCNPIAFKMARALEHVVQRLVREWAAPEFPLPLEDVEGELPDSDVATEDLLNLLTARSNDPERALEQNADRTSASSEQSEASPVAEAQHHIPRSLTRAKRPHSDVSRDSSSASCRRSPNGASNAPASRQASLAAQSVSGLTAEDSEDVKYDQGTDDAKEAPEALSAM